MKARRLIIVILGWIVLLAAIEINSLPAIYQHYARPSGSARYIFVDGGASIGQTIDHFYKTLGCSFKPWQIHAFEPNPYVLKHIKPRPNLIIHNKALWERAQEMEFFFNRDASLSGSLLDELKPSSTDVIRVEAINFGDWLRENFRESDFIWVKFDIEGAEYAVLESMLADDSVKYIDFLTVEFHPHLRKGWSKEKDRMLADQIRQRGVVVFSGQTGKIDGDWFRPNWCFPWAWRGLTWDWSSPDFAEELEKAYH